MSLYLLFVFGLAVGHAVVEGCTVNGYAGACISTTTCKRQGGHSTPGHSPGPNSIQCCTYGSCSVSGQTGKCIDTKACSGTSTAGHCPGPNNIQCCTKSVTNSGTGGKIVQWARTLKGKYPYSWAAGHRAAPGPSTGCCVRCGYSGPRPCRASTTVGFDCSGFTRWAVWKATGSDILGSGNTVSQERRLGSGRRVYGSFKPGDLIFYGTPSHHTAIYAGKTLIEAAHTGTLVREARYHPGSRYYRIH
jgi:cell wall-associated NlpC family hydrolase